MTTTWNVEERHLEYLTYTVEKMEAAGQKPYAVLFTERDSWAGDHTIKTLWKEEFGTLEDILHWFESDPHPTQNVFCEKVTGGVRDSGEQFYAAPCVPVKEDVYIWWNHDELTGEPAPRTVLVDAGYADEDDLADPSAEAWEDMERLSVHSEPLPLTVENLSAYMTEEVFTQYQDERIELIPARQVLEELTGHFAQQTEQDGGEGREAMLLAALSVEKINNAGMITAAIFALIVAAFTLTACFKSKGEAGAITVLGILALAAGVTTIQGAMVAYAVVMQK